jgi:hypothetical protein
MPPQQDGRNSDNNIVRCASQRQQAGDPNKLLVDVLTFDKNFPAGKVRPVCLWGVGVGVCGQGGSGRGAEAGKAASRRSAAGVCWACPGMGGGQHLLHIQRP